ncbi:unnamed protein product [Prunus brigantina]
MQGFSSLLHITNLTSLLSSLRKILENLYYLSKRGVVVHPKRAATVVELVHASGPAAIYRHKVGLEHDGPHALRATSAEQNRRSVLPNPLQRGRVKHLIGTKSRKVGGMCSADELERHDLLLEIIRAWSSSPVERQKGADVPLRTTESRVVKRGVNSALTLFRGEVGGR